MNDKTINRIMVRWDDLHQNTAVIATAMRLDEAEVDRVVSHSLDRRYAGRKTRAAE